MSLEVDYLLDRRRLKRKLGFWRIIAVVVSIVLIVGLFYKASDRISGFMIGDHIARLSIESVIINDAARMEALGAAIEDPNVHAIVVHLNSPGGTIVGSQALYESLRQAAQTKPVVAVMSEVATSGAYMAAIAADRIFAYSGTITGSIGVIMQTADITELLDSLGVKVESIKSSPLKASPNLTEPITPESRKAMQVIIMDMYDIFVDMVVERRALSREEVLALADGRIFTGRQALDYGLVDALGGEDQALRWLEEEKNIPKNLPIQSITIKREENWAEYVGRILGGKFFSTKWSATRLNGLVSLWSLEDM